jgi:hypothetical protein
VFLIYKKKMEKGKNFCFFFKMLRKRVESGELRVESWEYYRGKVNISAPWGVIAMVCSHCADSLPSAVTAVQPSERVLVL